MADLGVVTGGLGNWELLAGYVGCTLPTLAEEGDQAGISIRSSTALYTRGREGGLLNAVGGFCVPAVLSWPER